MNEEDKDQFKRAIKSLVETHQALKNHNIQGKELKEKLKDLKNIVLGYMEYASLDACNVTHNGKNGEVCVRTSKRTKSLKKEDAISQIEKYFAEQINVDQADERASLLWNAIQNTRSVTEHKAVSVKKL